MNILKKFFTFLGGFIFLQFVINLLLFLVVSKFIPKHIELSYGEFIKLDSLVKSKLLVKCFQEYTKGNDDWLKKLHINSEFSKSEKKKPWSTLLKDKK